MKILMFGWELPPNNTGGLGVACYGLAKGLSRRGALISFALPRRLRLQIPFMEILSSRLQNLEVTAINSMLRSYVGARSYRNSFSKLRTRDMKMYGSSLYDEAIRFGEMAALWSRHKPHQIIHCHDWMTYPAAMKARQISGRPYVAHIHATEYDRTGGNVNTKIAEIEYQGLIKADKVIAVSNYTKGIVNRYYGVPLSNIEVVHNGIDLSEFEPMELQRLFPKDNIVLFVGRLTYQKGVNYFLRAAKEVLKYQPNTIFLIVGHGDMYEQLIYEAARLGIGNRVVFTGFLTGTKLKMCYQMSNVFVMPSVSEPYGIVALEALAAGTPAVISKQSGVGETLSNVYKVDFWDVKKMAELIVRVLEKPKKAAKMAMKARMEAESMTWDEAARKTFEIYNKLIA